MSSIGFVTRTMIGSFGGAEVFNCSLIKGMTKAGVNVTTYRYNPRTTISFQRFILFFRATTSKEKVLLVSHSGLLDIILILLLAIFRKKIYVISHVGPGYRHIDNFFSFMLVKWIIYFFVNRHFLLTTKQAKKFKSPRFSIIPTIIRDEFIDKNINEQDDGYILYYGRISVAKGCVDLLKAFSAADISCKLVLIGPFEPSDEKIIRRTIEELGIKALVDIRPPLLEVNELVTCIDKSRLVIYPSYYDLYPLVIFESFLRGKICISTHVADNDLLYDDHGMLFDAGDISTLTKLIFSYYRISSAELKSVYSMRKKFKELSGLNCAKKIIALMEDMS